ncbi:hypothetical protein GCM10016455_09980 [Aliiroseovarius zhejiangensis]|uniref:TM2 domain-containing protein n=1 Tax=Aliiroseovarius zhejiangensis TaxID=1632025 RepID=A0ABQ3IV75_9RHOB|nr:TM2 domain-containing protein [Aliiroseovarius zhejiangensis]GHE91983.1 hypothetical protein GCM10016455_09980 [Aliiroseovarius zhejiangensis]
MTLTTEQQMLVEQRLANDKKSIVVAYLLWGFLGGFGAHRFYLGKTGSAVGQIILFVLGWLTVAFVVGFAFLIALGIWLLVDAFLIPGMIETDAKQKRVQISNELGVMSH